MGIPTFGWGWGGVVLLKAPLTENLGLWMDTFAEPLYSWDESGYSPWVGYVPSSIMGGLHVLDKMIFV